MAYPRLALALLLLSLASAAGAEPPRLVASIPPIHSLVAAVAGERASVHLLVPAGRSPHAYALKPSDTRALANAEAVFVAGDVTERFLDRPLAAVAGDASVVRMAEADGVRLLPTRAAGVWDQPATGRPAQNGHDHDHGGGDGHDPHVWLDPRNAIAFTRAVARELAELDPAGAARYRDNAQARIQTLRALDDQLAAKLEPVSDRPYVVFHDAYHYFEARYGLAAVGSITVDPGRPPGAERLAALRDALRQRGVQCLFTEPQFEPGVASTIVAGTDVRVAELDPLGVGLSPGPGLYPELMRSLGESLRRCLLRQ